MKTLIFNGSPRKNGDTASLLRILTGSLHGEFRVVDRMQELYRYIEDCDNVVIASPIYYAELTGKLLDVASRFQVYYSARYFRQAEPEIKPKKGGVVLVGGGDGDPKRAYATAKILLRGINARDIFPLVCSHATNTLPAAEDEEAVHAVEKLAEFLNGHEGPEKG